MYLIEMMEYKRIKDGVFKMSTGDRHLLFEEMRREYKGSEWETYTHPQWCEDCNVKQIYGGLLFYRCKSFRSCGRRICSSCNRSRKIDGPFVCSYHSNVTLRAMALRRLKYE